MDAWRYFPHLMGAIGFLTTFALIQFLNVSVSILGISSLDSQLLLSGLSAYPLYFWGRMEASEHTDWWDVLAEA